MYISTKTIDYRCMIEFGLLLHLLRTLYATLKFDRAGHREYQQDRQLGKT